MVLILLLLLVIFVDTYTAFFKPVKSWLGNLALPFYWLTDAPNRVGEWIDLKTTGRAELEEKIRELETEQQVYQGRLLRMADLAAENVRLRQLLNATELLQDRVLVTELIGVSPDPASQVIVINRGQADGVFEGQAVLDANGLMGQVIDVQGNYSRVLLISDSSHALPVQVLRNGVRSIAEGLGDYGTLRLRYVSPTTDIQVGDKLVSSGLGGRYPVGYPVGEVTSINNNVSRAYMEVLVQPAAWLDRSRHLLLVFSEVERLEEE